MGNEYSLQLNWSKWSNNGSDSSSGGRLSADSNATVSSSLSSSVRAANEKLLVAYREKYGVYRSIVVPPPAKDDDLFKDDDDPPPAYSSDRLSILDETRANGRWMKPVESTVRAKFQQNYLIRFSATRIFHRTKKQCLQMILYYLCLYIAILLPLVPIGFTYRYLFLSIDHPKHSRIILTEPGLNFRPRPADFPNLNTLIQYNRNDREKYMKLIKSINDAVKWYEPHNHTSSPYTENMETYWSKVCSFANPADDRYACRLNTQNFGSYCYRNMEYGIPDGTPCVLIRVNKVHGWVPEPYETFDELKQAGFPLNWRSEWFDRRYVPISCSGESSVDRELLGPTRYYYPFESGKRGIPLYFFPYLNQKNYKPPGVMVFFRNVTWSVVVRVECRLWARNVPHDREGPSMMPRGGVKFELFIDNGIVEKWADPERWPMTQQFQGRGRGMEQNN